MLKSNNPHFKRWLQPQWAALLSLTLMAPSANTHADTATIYGSLGNFDVVNNTGQSAHGFEIELEGLQPADVVYSFSAQRYGLSRIVPTATGVIVRWESPWNSLTGQFDAGTQPHTPNTPFAGTCYQWYPDTYDTAGCEHFGVSLNQNPGVTRYRWLVADAANLGKLTPVEPPVPIATPVYNIIPPVRAGDPPAIEVVVEAPEPAEVPHLYGDAQWIKIYVAQMPREVGLDELVTDNAVVPQDASKIEIDWALIQDEPATGSNGNRRQKRSQGTLLPTTRSVVRRIELYNFTGNYDPLTHEAMCGDLTCNLPADAELGEFISAQMTAANVQSNAVIVARSGSGSGKVASADGLVACGSKCVAVYEAGTMVSLTAKPDSNNAFAGWSGACSGSQLTCTIPANGITNVSAKFESSSSGSGSTNYLLSVKTAGGKGLISGAGGLITCGKTCAANLASGATVTLQATPESGFRFVNWSGACAGTGACTLTMNGNKSAQANFTK